MTRARLYKMTICSAYTWYDKAEEGARSFDLHFTVARRGKTRTVRRTLAKRGIPYAQQLIYRKMKKWIPRRGLKVKFEREQPALRGESKIRIIGQSMIFRGRRWSAKTIGEWKLSYTKKKRPSKRRKTKRGSRPRGRVKGR